MYFWAREYPVGDAAEEAQVQQKTAIDVYQWLSEVCSTRLITSGQLSKLMNLSFGISLRLCILKGEH